MNFDEQPKPKDPISEIAISVVANETYTLGKALGIEIEKLEITPEKILPLAEAAALAPDIQHIELLPFQSIAFQLTRTIDNFACKAQYTNRISPITIFEPTNLLGLHLPFSGLSLREKYLHTIGKVFFENIKGDILIDIHQSLIIQNKNPGMLLLRVPKSRLILTAAPMGEFASGSGSEAPILIKTKDERAVAVVGDFIKKNNSNGLNALLAVLLSEQLTPSITIKPGNEPFERYNLFHCMRQRYDALEGYNLVQDATVSLVPSETSGGFKFERLE